MKLVTFVKRSASKSWAGSTPQLMRRSVTQLVRHGSAVASLCAQARQVAWSVLITAVLLACSDTTGPGNCDPTAPGPSLAQVRLDSVPPRPTEPRTVDDHWAAIAREVPGGWGGLFLDDGVPTIYLVEPDLRTEAIDALIAFGIGQEFDMANARVWTGRWDFAQLYDWRWYIDARVGGPAGLVSRDIDEFRNRVVYGVLEAEMEAFNTLLESLAVACELVIVEISEPVTLAKRAV